MHHTFKLGDRIHSIQIQYSTTHHLIVVSLVQSSTICFPIGCSFEKNHFRDFCFASVTKLCFPRQNFVTAHTIVGLVAVTLLPLCHTNYYQPIWVLKWK
jgi:hypothetical protein